MEQKLKENEFIIIVVLYANTEQKQVEYNHKVNSNKNIPEMMRIINKLNWFERNVLGLSPKDKIRVAYEEGAKAEKKLIQKDLWNIYCMENDIDRLKAIYDLGLKRELKQKHLGDKNNGTF